MAEKTTSLVDFVGQLKDPRRACRNRKHTLVDILVSGFCAILGGAEDYVEMASWVEGHQETLRTFLEFSNGTPSHDTYNRVFSLIDPLAFQEVLLQWLRHRRPEMGELIHIDGKTMRGTRSDTRNPTAFHLVSAWASENHLTLGQVATAEKSNEITAIPELLNLLDVKEKIITIDAMGCQHEILEKIREGGGDYVVAVKENQPTLYADVKTAFETAASEIKIRETTEIEEEHGRRTERTVQVLSAKHASESQKNWTGLNSLVMITTLLTCATTGKTSETVRYYISSIVNLSVSSARHIIRSHWSIENNLHWVLDVAFREDARHIYDKTSATNWAMCERLAVSVLKNDDAKKSMKCKRKSAGWSAKYLCKLLGISSV